MLKQAMAAPNCAAKTRGSRPNMVVFDVGRDGHRCNNRHYLPVFTKSKIWSVSRVSAVLIE
jgi:hypothetical protein